ncbi:MAG: M90 family metallopeptidase [Pseudomonadota bacterium]
MAGLLAIAVCGALFSLAWLLPRWRLRRALARPLPPAFLAILERNVTVYAGMPAPLQAQLQQLLKQFLHQKKFVGCEGLDISDEMRVTIAAQACLLLLNRHTRVYPGLHMVLVYPTAFLVPRAEVDAAGIVTPVERGLLGESWSDGRVILAWDHVRRGGREPPEGQNVVLHEFAHQLDSESGSNNGAPFLGKADHYRRWSAVLSRDFAQLRADAFEAQPGVLDHYGASSPAEFFAVATETFFENPYALADQHAELYEQFLQYYRVDPRQWMAPPPAPAPTPSYAMSSAYW